MRLRFWRWLYDVLDELKGIVGLRLADAELDAGLAEDERDLRGDLR